jgi:hypothetical protein
MVTQAPEAQLGQDFFFVFLKLNPAIQAHSAIYSGV